MPLNCSAIFASFLHIQQQLLSFPFNLLPCQTNEYQQAAIDYRTTKINGVSGVIVRAWVAAGTRLIERSFLLCRLIITST